MYVLYCSIYIYMSEYMYIYKMIRDVFIIDSL